MEKKEKRKVDNLIVYEVGEEDKDMDDEGWKKENDEDKVRKGVIIGQGIGGIEGIVEEG